MADVQLISMNLPNDEDTYYFTDKDAQDKIDALGTASTKNVPTSGDAGNNEVVLGNDTRLTDARPASDVSAWAKESTKPSYTKSEVGLGNVDNTSDSTKKTNFTGSIASGNTGFTTGGDVYTALGNKVDKVNGKGLSTEDYTTTEKNKLAGISTNANKVEASTTNGNIKIDSVETPVYRNYGNNTVLQTDKTPFLTRQTLNPTGFSGYVREKLIGASYAWNNRFNNGNFPSASAYGWRANNATITTGVGSIKFTASAWNGYIVNNHDDFATADTFGTSGHVLLITCMVKTASATINVQFASWSNPVSSGTTSANTVASTSWQMLTLFIKTPSGGAPACNIALTDTRSSGWDEIEAKDFQIHDLTLAFGSTIADHLYSLTNNGGITKLRDMGCPIDKYTPYGNYLVSSKTSGKKIVGFNLWDEEYLNCAYKMDTGNQMSYPNAIGNKNPIIVSPNASYYFKIADNSRDRNVAIFTYDVNHTFIERIISFGGIVTMGNNVHYINFYWETSQTIGVYDHTFCINISDTNKNGQYAPYSSITYSLGNDELRGKFDLVNGEIVASGDVKESNGEITRKYGIVDLGTLTWINDGNGIFRCNNFNANAKPATTYSGVANIIAEKYTAGGWGEVYDSLKTNTICYRQIATNNNRLAVVSGTSSPTGYMIFELITSTTEQSTPFADPMSLVGATTEEYIDTRDIPCPVGAERQYMGQSEDVIEIPSMPQSDGKRKLVAETSGGKTQYYFEDDKNGAGTQVNLMTYDTASNKYVFPSDGYISLSNAGASVGDYITMSVYGANDNLICGLRCDTSVASIVTVQNLFVKRGMKCYVRATSSTGSFTALFTPLA